MSLRGCTCLKCAPFLCTPWKYSSGGILASAAAKCLPQNTQNSQNLLQGMVSHRFHRFTQMVRVSSWGCTCLKCTNRASSGLPQISDRHRWLGCVDSSGGILASAVAKCLPQNTQNSQNRLQGMVSHRFHRFTQMVRVRRSSHRIHRIHRSANFRGCTCLRSALPLARARSAPTKQTVVLPQISQIYTEAANFRLVHFLLGWCTSYSVGALLALASGKAERRQVHPLEGTQTICVDL